MTNIARRPPDEIVLADHPGALAPAALPAFPHWGDALDIQRILRRVTKRKHLIAIVFLMVVIPAAVATFLTTPLYRSTALVQVNPDPVQVLPYRDIADTTVSGANFEDYMGTQEQILKGPGLKERVAKKIPGLKDVPASAELSKLGDRYGLRKIEKSQLFELSYVAADPTAAAAIVNLFAEEYVKQNFEMRQGTRIKAEQDLKKELDGLERRLQMSEQELMTYAKTHDIMNVEQGQVDPMQERLSSVSQQVVDAEAQVVVARSSLTALQSASVDEFPQRLVTLEIGQLQTKLLQSEQELTSLRGTFGENWPAVAEKRNELVLVKKQLQDEKAAVLARHLEQARMDLQTAESRHTMASQTLAEQKALVNQFHDASIQYNILRREVETNRNLYDGLLQRLKQTGVMAGFQFGNISIVEPGRPSRIVDSPKIAWNLGLASLLGLGLGICTVILLEFWDTSITTLEDAEQLAPLPTLGSVPLLKTASSSFRSLAPSANGQRRPVALLQRSGEGPSIGTESVPFEESIRAICSSILLSRSDERPRVIAVTSATHSEGKTTLVSHLGKAFADAGVRTLLVEADLRRPDLSKSFDLGTEDGLSLYLAGHTPHGPKIHETEIPNLFVAPGGPVPPNPAALLHSERLGTFLASATATYDVIILDAPPLLSMADARILGMKADGVVLVVRAGRTGRNLVRRAWVQLENSGANVLGMVLNGWEPGRAELSHYHYYHSQA